jgi:hypothetical protein
MLRITEHPTPPAHVCVDLTLYLADVDLVHYLVH